MRHQPSRWTVSLLLAASALGCASGSDTPSNSNPVPSVSGSNSPPPEGPSGGDAVTLSQRAEYLALSGELSVKANAARELDADGLRAAYPSTLTGTLDYDPLLATNFDLIQASPLTLGQAQQDALQTHGFVIDKGQAFGTFAEGYRRIYEADLPVYFTADAILDAVHRAYDDFLKDIEKRALVATLDNFLSEVRATLATRTAPTDSERDLDLYLGVAQALLTLNATSNVAGVDAAKITQLAADATKAEGIVPIELFGVAREIDTSQFTPRGHYAGDPELEQYFRAMIWLGRIDFRLLETQSDGSQVFHRDQFDAMLALYAALNARSTSNWATLDGIVEAFVGESDYGRVPQIDALLTELGGPEAVQSATSEEIAKAIVQTGFGEQRIATDLIVKQSINQPTLPLNRSFAVFGQRFTLDSEVFSNLSFDRVPFLRYMVNPADAAFAALGNNAALDVLDGELTTWPKLAGEYARTRTLADSYPTDFWQSTLYNLWSYSLRALSPTDEQKDPVLSGLPQVAATRAWGKRLLNTQLGSWSQLRHDSILYAKQSYAAGLGCDYPDGYVEPYPELFARLLSLGEKAVQVSLLLDEVAPTVGADMRTYFDEYNHSLEILHAISLQQRSGTVLDAEQLAFINDAVHVEQIPSGCTTEERWSGWYVRLFKTVERALEYDPQIADVHTQPYEGDAPVGYVLHVGTSSPRLLVSTVETCMGPRAYAGVVFGYHEKITSNFERLTDEQWEAELDVADPPTPAWLDGIAIP